MISFDSYNKVKQQLTKVEALEVAVIEEDIAEGEPYQDGLTTSLQIPVYFSRSRFASWNNDHFVFAMDVFHADFKEGYLFMNCLKNLDIVISRRSKISMVSLPAMQAIYAMQKVSPLQFDDGGRQMEEQLPITFLNAEVGPVGVQQKSSREEALIVLFNSCYVHVPHEHVYLVRSDGKIAESAKRDHLVNGDRLYLIFRYIRQRTYNNFFTSQGPFAWNAEAGTVIPDIIACSDVLAGDHRLIGFVETVEAPKYIRVKLLLSTISNAHVLDIPPSF